MRSDSKNISLSLIALLALTCFCCGKDDSPGLDQAGSFPAVPQPDLFADSGKRLAGEFVTQVVNDIYAPEGRREGVTLVFRFDEGGSFKVEKFEGSNATIEEGSYIIDNQGGLVLYFDREGGALLESARRERYNIISQADLDLRLEQPPARKLVLRKR